MSIVKPRQISPQMRGLERDTQMSESGLGDLIFFLILTPISQPMVQIERVGF
jgi:hypothetical protein